MKGLLVRAHGLMVRPGDEWRIIKEEPAAYANIIVRYVGILAAIPPTAAIAGRFMFDKNIPDRVLSLSLNYLLVTNLLWYGMNIINVMITGAVIAAIMATTGDRWSGLRGLQIAAYSFTPLFVVSLLSMIPHMTWLAIIAILYGVFLLYLGIRTFAAMPGTRAAWYTAASFTVAAVIVGVMNLFEYMFESYVANRLVL
jgi:hypothetical protein